MAIPTSDMPGHQALRDRIHAALDSCVESPSLEFKESAEWSTLEFKIIRTVMAMANLRDGGVVVIGVSERDGRWNLTGIRHDHLQTYDVDDLQDAVNRYASPPISVQPVIVAYGEGRVFLAIEVREFHETPIVCRKDGPGLKQGVIYVRRIAGKIETSEIRTADDLRDLLDLAAEKRARRMIDMARRIGMEVPVPGRRFDDELEGL